MPGFENFAIDIGKSLIGGFDIHYPKTIRMEDEPYITRHSYYKHVVGMTDFESTLLVWAENGQPLSPADRTALEAAVKKLAGKGQLPSFDSYAADPARHTMAAAIAHRTIFDEKVVFDKDMGARGGFTDTRGDAPPQGKVIPSKLDSPGQAAAFGGIPLNFLLLAGAGIGLFVMAKR